MCGVPENDLFEHSIMKTALNSGVAYLIIPDDIVGGKNHDQKACVVN